MQVPEFLVEQPGCWGGKLEAAIALLIYLKVQQSDTCPFSIGLTGDRGAMH